MRGGYGTGGHRSLGERVVDRVSSAPGEAGEQGVQTGPARHCLVGGRPSLLVEWCQTERGWEGRVISVIWLEAVGWATVERWLPAADITPVEVVSTPRPAGP